MPRSALVTGSSSGIGRAIALRLAADGFWVLLADVRRDPLTGGEPTDGLIRASGGACEFARADVSSRQDCDRLAAQAVAAAGRLDVLVNNAAYQMAQPDGIEEITTEQFDRVMKTNLYAMFWLCKKALPHMSAGASIINTSSVQASSPSPELMDYATTKAGIANFTRGLATSLGERGIRVNSVAPGPIWTPLIPATMPEEKVESFGQQTPLGRVGQPAELAPAYVFLASGKASYITGEVLAVTGGQPVTV
jgi:NAD(P)-dependent dehydrogenase (short-subunit alcohol dehydrogenase family)